MTRSDASLLAEPLDLRLDGRTAWVTGASRGLGRTIAFALAGAGAEVLLTARSASALEAIADEIRAHGGVAHVAAGSVADPKCATRAAERVAEVWGRLDVLVNNAGVSPVFARSEAVSDAQFRDVLDTNLVGLFCCCRAALGLFEPARGGSIVNLSSVHGSRAHERLIAYAASKGGVEMATRTLAVEWATRGVRVNAVAPGYLNTDMTAGLRDHPRWGDALRARIPMGRFGDTAEVASAVLFLAAPLSSYLTGTTLYVDGGWTAQ